MHLISSLIAGIRGAEGGTADLYQRGTTTPVTYYTDFEATGSDTVQIDLDANGRAEVYVNEYVRVLVKDSDGSTVADFVDGVGGSNVELRTDSIKSTPYGGGASAANNPISLKAAFDKMATSFGTTDFQVLYNGAATNMSTVVANLVGRNVFSVLSYGAVGDGVADDLSAINAASSAANAAGGGVVYFPPGTYLISGDITTYETVSIEGSGSSITFIVVDSTSSPFILGDGPPVVRGLSVSSSGTYTGTWYNVAAASLGSVKRVIDVVFAECYIGIRSQATANAHTLEVTGCTAGPCSGYAAVASSVCTLRVEGCQFDMAGLSVGSAVYGGTSSDLFVYNTKMDFSSITTGQPNGVESAAAASNTVRVFGCVFVPPETSVGSWRAIYTTDVSLVESGNELQSTAVNAGAAANYMCYGTAAFGAQSQLMSRPSLYHAVLAPNADPLELPTNHAGTVSVDNDSSASHSGNVGVNAEGSVFIPPGSPLTLIFKNTTGASVTYEWGTSFESALTTFAVANGTRRAFLFVLGDDFVWHPVADLAGAEA